MRIEHYHATRCPRLIGTRIRCHYRSLPIPAGCARILAKPYRRVAFPFASTLRVIAGITPIAIAIRIALSWNAFAWLEQAGAKLWSILAPIAARTKANAGNVETLLLGALWGWLPCGLVYSILLYAAASGHALRSALIMIAFGLGTLPSMLGSTLLATQLARLFKRRETKWIAAALLATFGIWTVLAALPRHHHHWSSHGTRLS